MVTHDVALQVSGIDVHYGRLQALSQVSLELRTGEALGLLGANGAGKTTLLNTLSGFMTPSTGSIRLFGQSIGGMAPHRIVRNGLLHISQERDLFGELTVLDNLRLGARGPAEARFARNVERVYGFFPRLKERATQRANTMSGGEQQMLAMGRALMAEPRVLLFDEPSAGLSPLFVTEIGNMMKTLRDEGAVSILLVEQNMLLAAQVVNRFHILRAGTVVAQGEAADLQKDHADLAREFYL
ncbi:ABC transporter ATP-binding protein [Acidovorax sp.]|uniref:ABC transporter ATP-binding protein n=1 Tax=Acidovorax sp. TaxID=1872122 RepID=UPI003BAF9F29